jgi:hypothetical protein
VSDIDLTRCRCGSDDIVVVVCDHVANGDDPTGKMHVTAAPGYPVTHRCDDPDCGEQALCGDCWSDL